MKLPFARKTRRNPTEADAAAGPNAGNDNLSEDKLVEQLPSMSQAELASVEERERSQRERSKVLHKLKWLRGKEPLPGYDALSDEDISAELAKADTPTLKAVRAYERKHQNRRGVMLEVARLIPESQSSAADDRLREEKAAGVSELMRSRS